VEVQAQVIVIGERVVMRRSVSRTVLAAAPLG
jgi:hypothetical protein